ncbi:MAG TPA: beta-propeller domain-containing protein, partial [Longimicrobium sp.]|nr:beta-propeller domain-containing protein [Longimicrobium sp.]
MKKITALAALVCIASVAGGCAESASRTRIPAAPEMRTLPAFASEAELAGYLRRLAKEQQRAEANSEFVGQGTSGGVAGDVVAPMPPPLPEPEMSAAPGAQDASSREAPGESVTNVQHAGVDEGGIVKVHGNHLVMLRRGRLFTVAIGGDTLRPVSAVDAFGPDIDPAASWYDELLVSGDAVVVIGFSYERGGTEVGLFRIDPDGRLRHRSTYHLRSNDYYSSRNYASRLVEGKLIFYTPLYLALNQEDPFAEFPAVRRWHPGAAQEEFKRLLPATRVYQPGRPVSGEDVLALHTVTVCDLESEEMACEGTAVLGPPGRVFYVSPGAVYVWVSDWRRGKGDEADPASMLYRIPL